MAGPTIHGIETGPKPMNLAQLLLRSARAAPQAPALALGARVVADYGGLARRAAALAGALRGRFGLVPGDRVVAP